jgi:hypothetical protein
MSGRASAGGGGVEADCHLALPDHRGRKGARSERPADRRPSNARVALAPRYRERYQRNKRRLGRQRGAKVAQIDVARKLTEAIWHMLTNNQPFAPAPGGSALRLAA